MTGVVLPSSTACEKDVVYGSLFFKVYIYNIYFKYFLSILFISFFSPNVALPIPVLAGVPVVAQ